MPKVSKIQPGFTTGEISKQVYGRVDQPRYEQGLAFCQNYIPLIQGPLVRRPGTKFVCYVKDSTKPPVLIPFQFSVSQNYMLEVGEKYIRFYQNEGQIVTSSNSFIVAGLYGQVDPPVVPSNTHTMGFQFTGIRSVATPSNNEQILSSSVLTSGSVLELQTPYFWTDVKQIKWAQKQDTLYLTHPSYQPMKLQRTGVNTWDLKVIGFQDGPYLPLNSYQTIADNARTGISVSAPIAATGSTQYQVNTYPICYATSIVAVGSQSLSIQFNTTPYFQTGDNVFITGVTATGQAQVNNVTMNALIPGFEWSITNSSSSQASWTVVSCQNSSIIVTNPSMSGFGPGVVYGGGGSVQPALLQLITASSGTQWADLAAGSSGINLSTNTLRNIGIVLNGIRYWGNIYRAQNAASFYINMGLGQGMPIGSASFWYLGTYSRINGFPSACAFYQDRLVFNGPPSSPQEIDGSMTSLYETFSASGSNAQVSNNNALQFNLASQDLNAIRWIKSNPQGLLLGTAGGEWAVTPGGTNNPISPTNIQANQVSAFGSADVDSILVGNAALYVQRAQRKLRELLYYWQVGNFRSTNISELAQHITLPTLTKIANQKEPHAVVWGLRSDGQLLTLTYNRDDVTFQANAGWARQPLGGRSDSAGSAPTVNSIAVIPSSDATYDELWMVTKRYMNGSTLGCVEYMTKFFDENTPQEQAYHFDCGATYNSSIVVTGISVAGSCVITAPNHGITNSSVVRFYNCVGMNISYADANGVSQSSNPINYQTFIVQSVSTNAFFIQDFTGSYINTNSCSVYVGSAVVNQLVSSISGLGFLAGETVSVLADGGIHVNTSITQAGVLNLAYPAAVVSVGYQYNSDAQMLRTHEGSAQGTSIGSFRRVNRVAFMLHNVGDLSFGPSFTNLIPAEFYQSDVNKAGVAPPLFDGIYRDGIEGEAGFTDTVCFRQNSGLPGMIQSVTRFLEESDV